MPEEDVRSAPRQLHGDPPVIMFTAPNPGPKTLDGTHTYLVGAHGGYFIDPGPAIPSYISALAEWIRENQLSVQGVLLTHGHPDHAPGAVQLSAELSVPVRGAVDLDRTVLGESKYLALTPDHSFPVGRDRLHVIAAPGHTQDHLAFWLEHARILFTGDTVLGRGTSVIAPPEGNMTQYMQTLERMRALDARIIAPGHGPVVDNPEEKLAEYIAHRRRREDQVLTALSAASRTVDELVALMYVDTDASLHGLARASVEAQLEKLQGEGKVERVGAGFRLRR